MIQETCLEIGESEERWVKLREARGARRRRIHAIDQLIEEFEKLNLADERDVPAPLRDRVASLVDGERHPVIARPSDEVSISEWMDALYDLQDRLMFGAEEGD
jgi:hypothetical protein